MGGGDDKTKDEQIAEDFQKMDLNGDAVVDAAEFAAHKKTQAAEDEELIEDVKDTIQMGKEFMKDQENRSWIGRQLQKVGNVLTKPETDSDGKTKDPSMTQKLLAKGINYLGNYLQGTKDSDNAEAAETQPQVPVQ